MERNYVCFYMCDNSLVVLSILFFVLVLNVGCWYMVVVFFNKLRDFGVNFSVFFGVCDIVCWFLD